MSFERLLHFYSFTTTLNQKRSNLDLTVIFLTHNFSRNKNMSTKIRNSEMTLDVLIKDQILCGGAAIFQTK